MRHLKNISLAALVCVALAACGGGGNTTSPAVQAAQDNSATPSVAGQATPALAPDAQPSIASPGNQTEYALGTMPEVQPVPDSPVPAASPTPALTQEQVNVLTSGVEPNVVRDAVDGGKVATF